MVGVSRGTAVVMVLGVLLGIVDGAFNGVFHVKHWLFLLWMGWCFGF